MKRIYTVSYTHLDVYKRQTLIKSHIQTQVHMHSHTPILPSSCFVFSLSLCFPKSDFPEIPWGSQVKGIE